MKVKNYKPDLQSFMALCASNYIKLSKLIRLFPKDSNQKSLTIRIENQPNLCIHRVQMSRYTETFQLTQVDKMPYLGRDYLVRIYHDAQMAEILSGVNDSMLPPIYPVPNNRMKQADEKMQLNQFLSEWLSFCLENGQFHIDSKNQLAF